MEHLEMNEESGLLENQIPNKFYYYLRRISSKREE